MASEMYTMKTDNSKKRFIIGLKGFFQAEQAGQFLEDYQATLSKFNTSGYSFLLDCSKLSVIKQELLPILKQCCQLYISSGFKKIVLIEPEGATAKMQVKRIAIETGLTAIFVSSLGAAEEQL